MKINGSNYDVDQLVNTFHTSFYNRTTGGLLLQPSEQEILDKYNIDYNKYSTIRELVFEIEEVLNQSYGYEVDDLEKLSMDLAEKSYYLETNK